jgi:hypothetical protein
LSLWPGFDAQCRPAATIPFLNGKNVNSAGLASELSFWFPLAPLALLLSKGAPTAGVLPSPRRRHVRQCAAIAKMISHLGIRRLDVSRLSQLSERQRPDAAIGRHARTAEAFGFAFIS